MSHGNKTVYDRFRGYLEKSCGILLGDNKQFLVESRLNRLLKSHDIANLSDLVDKLESSPYVNLRQIVIEAMTTNETLWMRDSHPFNWLKSTLLKEVYKQNKTNQIKIWSAACSSGQEPYSLSIMVEEAKRTGLIPSSMDVKIVATDISRGVLEIAQAGVYDTRSLSRGLPKEYQAKYFKSMGSSCYQINKEIQKRVDFKYINLKDNFSMLGKFDIVFCRNVLIYFSSELKQDILTRIGGVLKPEGYLFLGGSESLNGLPDRYEMIKYNPGIAYKKKS